MGYDEIYETYQEVSKEHINRPLFDHSTDSAEETIEDIRNNKIVIYTAFTGDYDTLKYPEVIDDNCDYICFTDNPELTSDLWKIIPMEESVLDNNRKAKKYKLLPHKYLKDYKYSFWLDGTFKINIFIKISELILKCWYQFILKEIVFMRNIKLLRLFPVTLGL